MYHFGNKKDIVQKYNVRRGATDPLGMCRSATDLSANGESGEDGKSTPLHSNTPVLTGFEPSKHGQPSESHLISWRKSGRGMSFFRPGSSIISDQWQW